MLLDVIHILMPSLSPIPQYRNVLYVSAATVYLIMLNLFRCFGELTIQEYLIFFSQFTFCHDVVYHNFGSSFCFFFPVNVDTSIYVLSGATFSHI